MDSKCSRNSEAGKITALLKEENRFGSEGVGVILALVPGLEATKLWLSHSKVISALSFLGKEP